MRRALSLEEPVLAAVPPTASRPQGCYDVDEKALKLSVLKAELIAAELHRAEEATAATKILNEYTKNYDASSGLASDQ